MVDTEMITIFFTILGGSFFISLVLVIFNMSIDN